jgi:hypothetical protein
MAEFGGLLTLHGHQDLAQAAVAGPALALAHIAVGDGGGAAYDPVETQTALINERGRYPVTSVAIQPDGRIVATANIPASEGGWHIREAALITGAGRMFMVAKYPPMFKPGQGSGGALDLTVAMIADIGNAPAAAIAVTVQPSTKVAWSRHGRAPFIAVDALQHVPPANPVEGALIAVQADPAPTGAFAGRGGWLAELTDGAWTFTPVWSTTIVRLPDGTFRQRVVPQEAASLWTVWTPTSAHTHITAQIIDFIPVGDARWLRRDTSDAVLAMNARHTFQTVRIGAGAPAGWSQRLEFFGGGDAASIYFQKSPGGLAVARADPVSGAFVQTAYFMDEAFDGSHNFRGGVKSAGNNSGFYADYLEANGRNVALFGFDEHVRLSSFGPQSVGQDLLALKHDASAQLLWRDGGYRQIATENRLMLAGTGLTGGGSLGADRTFAVDTAWLDARIQSFTGPAGRVVLRAWFNPWWPNQQVTVAGGSYNFATGAMTFSTAMANANYRVTAIHPRARQYQVNGASVTPEVFDEHVFDIGQSKTAAGFTLPPPAGSAGFGGSDNGYSYVEVIKF